MVATGIV